MEIAQAEACQPVFWRLKITPIMGAFGFAGLLQEKSWLYFLIRIEIYNDKSKQYILFIEIGVLDR